MAYLEGQNMMRFSHIYTTIAKPYLKVDLSVADLVDQMVFHLVVSWADSMDVMVASLAV